MELLIKKIASRLESAPGDLILQEGLSNLIDNKNFRKIQRLGEPRHITFVDGGNMEIIRTPGLSVFYNRIAQVSYFGNKRISSKINEFFSIISAGKKDGRLVYSVNYDPETALPDLQFDSHDKALSVNHRSVGIAQIGDIVRRYAELKTSIDAGGPIGPIIVIDGSLDCGHPIEQDLIEELCKMEVLAISKTSSQITDAGSPIGYALDAVAPYPEWCYQVAGSKIKKYFVKLHRNSGYRFMIDSPSLSNDVLSLLKEISKDPIFLGYPYGLIDADRRARVSKQERDTLKLKVEIKLKGLFPQLSSQLNSLNAHDILDSIS